MKTITIDGCSICQLKCVQCPISQMGYKNTIGKGYLSIKDFQAFTETHPDIKSIVLDCSGELFLNPDLGLILRDAAEKEIMLSSSGGVNLNTVLDREILKDLVVYRLQYLNVSIDGATQETYEQYRIGGSYAKVIENLAIINNYKRQLGTPYPKMQWQFIVFGHNEHELPRARKTAQEFGMRFWPKMNWNSEYSPIKNVAFVKQHTGWDVTTREEYEKKSGVSYVRSTCYELWLNPRRSWNLSCIGCSWNTWSRFNRDSIRYAKNVLIGEYPVNQPIPCNDCEILQGLISTGQYLSNWEVLNHVVKSRIAAELKYAAWRKNL